VKQCPYCSKMYTPPRKNSPHCGKVKCAEAHKTAEKKKQYAKHLERMENDPEYAKHWRATQRRLYLKAMSDPKTRRWRLGARKRRFDSMTAKERAKAERDLREYNRVKQAERRARLKEEAAEK
jgi:hypothetical protein